MRIDEFEFQDRNGNEIEPTKNQLVVYIKSLHKQIAELEQQLKSQPAEIVEKIREFCLTDHKFKECEIYLREDNGQTIYSFLDTILKEYQK